MALENTGGGGLVNRSATSGGATLPGQVPGDPRDGSSPEGRKVGARGPATPPAAPGMGGLGRTMGPTMTSVSAASVPVFGQDLAARRVSSMKPHGAPVPRFSAIEQMREKGEL